MDLLVCHSWESSNLNSFHTFLDNELVDCFVQFKQNIEPDDRLFFHNESITFERFLWIIQLHEKFVMKTESERIISTYLDLYKESKSLAGLGYLFWIVSNLKIDNENQIPDEDLVVEMKYLQELYIFSESRPIDERLFRMMMTNWTRLQVLWIANPVEQVGQRLLEQTPDY